MVTKIAFPSKKWRFTDAQRDRFPDVFARADTVQRTCVTLRRRTGTSLSPDEILSKGAINLMRLYKEALVEGRPGIWIRHRFYVDLWRRLQRSKRAKALSIPWLRWREIPEDAMATFRVGTEPISRTSVNDQTKTLFFYLLYQILPLDFWPKEDRKRNLILTEAIFFGARAHHELGEEVDVERSTVSMLKKRYLRFLQSEPVRTWLFSRLEDPELPPGRIFAWRTEKDRREWAFFLPEVPWTLWQSIDPSLGGFLKCYDLLAMHLYQARSVQLLAQDFGWEERKVEQVIQTFVDWFKRHKPHLRKKRKKGLITKNPTLMRNFLPAPALLTKLPW